MLQFDIRVMIFVVIAFLVIEGLSFWLALRNMKEHPTGIVLYKIIFGLMLLVLVVFLLFLLVNLFQEHSV